MRPSAAPGDELDRGRREIVDAQIGALDSGPARVHLAPRPAADEDGDQAGVGGGEDVVVDAIADVSGRFGALAGELDQPCEEGRGGLLDAP